ncbi:MAG TPA: hypothetical protein VM491_10565, partial [Burkholderiaceae bacterium]|nr:hypothetical protein [Burkholderiaceae bacterium]
MNESLTELARAAAARAAWQEAYDLLAQADELEPLAGPDLALLAQVAYAAGHLDVTIDAWERAHANAARGGDTLAAARAATQVALHLLLDTALLAPVRGWIKRAERLLENLDDTPVHAWLAVIRNYERLLFGDFAEARRWARRAIQLGTRLDPAAAAIGRIAEARSLILDGDVEQGLKLLDESAVATVSGELDPFAEGMVYCEVICGLQGLGQYGLAEQWTQAMERWRRGRGIGSIHGRCRVHRAQILRLRGFSGEAEQEALAACDELGPYLRRELGWPLTELGQIRLRTGNIDGAEQAFVAAHERGWDPQPGLALVALARGDVARAAASIRDALEHPSNVPSKELPPRTELRRAPLLEAQVDIAVAAGDRERARQAAQELQQVAVAFGSEALAASAARARAVARLAEGDAAGARADFDEAIQLWSEIGAPYETALARLGLGQACRALGSDAQAQLEFRAARAGFERVGATHQAARADRELGAPAPMVSRPSATHESPGPPVQATPAQEPRAAPNEVFRREGEYWCVTSGDRTIRLRDAKGMRYLAQLLAHPDRDFLVFDLISAVRGASPEADGNGDADLAVTDLGDAGQLLDARAKAAYRRRLAEIDEDIEEARNCGDAEREMRAESERDFLLRELARAVGLDGRDRRAGAASERARVSVTRAIRLAIDRIREHHPRLAE